MGWRNDRVYEDTPWEYRGRGRRFRDPGGRSALHPGKRTEACPTCKEPNRLTAGPGFGSRKLGPISL